MPASRKYRYLSLLFLVLGGYLCFVYFFWAAAREDDSADTEPTPVTEKSSDHREIAPLEIQDENTAPPEPLEEAVTDIDPPASPNPQASAIATIFETEPRPLRRVMQILSAAEAADASEIKALILEVQANQSVHERLALDNLLLARWTELDPQAALAHVISDPKSHNRDLWLVMQTWTANDPSGIVAAIETLPISESEKDSAYKVALSTFAEADPESAIRYFDEMDASRLEPWFVNSLHYKLAEKDLGGATQRALAMTDPSLQRNAMEAVTKVIAVNYEPEAGLSEANTLPENYRNWATSRVFDKWIRDAPEQAKQRALSLNDKSQRSAAVSAILPAMTRQNPEATIQWSQANLSETELRTAYESIYNEWKKQDAESANVFFEIETSGQP